MYIIKSYVELVQWSGQDFNQSDARLWFPGASFVKMLFNLIQINVQNKQIEQQKNDSINIFG